MSENQSLDEEYAGQEITTRRRKLLPWWIKFFSWLFIVLSLFGMFSLLAGLAGYHINLSLYGISSTNPLTFTGLSIIALILFKGVTGIGLWFEQDWAIIFGKIDATIGIVVCLFAMIIYPEIEPSQSQGFNFRLEIFILIVYFNKLIRIKEAWEKTLSTK